MAPTVEAWAWAAGLFEGEGSIVHGPMRRRKGPPGTRRRLSLEMKDEDVVRRFAAVVDGGHVRMSRRINRVNRENHHDIYIWECNRWVDTERILTAFLPYLGERRRRKAEGLLADPAGPVGRKPRDLSPETQAAIRAEWARGELSQRAIATRFGVTQPTISRTVNP